MKNEVNKEYTTSLGLIGNLEEPARYQVWMHNDDFTPMEFVVSILETFFYMDRRKAVEAMQTAHQKGKVICGVFSKDFAEAKVSQVIDYATLHEHPLHCSMEAA